MPLHKFLYYSIGGRLRARRQRWVKGQFGPCPRVLDIGGLPATWTGEDSRFAEHVTVLNTFPKPPACCLDYVRADGRSLPFESAAFDLAFSNSVIEHLESLEDQRQFAREMLRVGGRVYCQTPNRWFPVEPHHLTLFLHWLPERCFTPGVHRWLSFNGWRGKPRERIRFLTRTQLASLFPGCQIRVEYFLGWPKSFAAWR